MDFIFITNDPRHATLAQGAGIDYVMVDLEILGKEARQGHLNTVISRHSLDDVERIRDCLDSSKLLVRINPLNASSEQEIEACIKLGADVLMLPMFTTASEVTRFVEIVHGRTRSWLLLETPQAMARVDEILDCQSIDAIHVGLNDLHLGLHLDFMFELVAHGTIEWLAARIRSRGIDFGFGGVARLGGSGALDARLILAEHVRLGSKRVILSRDFRKLLDLPRELAEERLAGAIHEIREELALCSKMSAQELCKAHDALRNSVKAIVAGKVKLL